MSTVEIGLAIEELEPPSLMFNPFFDSSLDKSTSTFGAEVVVKVFIIDFIGREVGIYVKNNFLNFFPLSSPLSFDYPTPVSPSYDMFEDRRGAFVSNRRTK